MGFFKVSPQKILKKRGITLNKKQAEIVKSVEENEVTITVATRRGGKSLIASACASAVLMVPENRVALAGPYLTHTTIVFDEVVKTMKKDLQLQPTKLNNKDKYLEFDWSSKLKAATLKNRASIVGVANDLMVFDEIGLADYMSDTSYLYQESIPTLLTTGGHILVISTPRGFNHLYDLWNNAVEEETWDRVKYTIWDVDHIPREKIKKLEQQYIRAGLENTWRQEFLAEFTSFSGAIFDFQPLGRLKEEMPTEGLILIGVDPGLNTAIVKIVVNDKGVWITDIHQKTASTEVHGKYLQSIYTDDVDLAVVDSAAAQFREDMAYDYDVQLVNAIKAVDDGINFLKRLKGKIYFNVNAQSANEFEAQWANYSMHNDKVVKKDDHMIDAVRYALYTAYKFFPEYFDSLLTEEISTEQLLKEAI